MLNEKSSTALLIKIFRLVFIVFTVAYNVSVSIFNEMKEFVGVDIDLNLGTINA
jgi:hypothetical protein